MMWNGLKRIGWLFVLVLCLSSPLLAQDYSWEEEQELERLLMMLQDELLNSKNLLQKQRDTLANLNRDLLMSESTLRTLKENMKSLKTHITELEETIAILKVTLEHSRTQTAQVSESLNDVSDLFEKHERTTKIVLGVGGTILVVLASILTYKIIEDRQ